MKWKLKIIILGMAILMVLSISVFQIITYQSGKQAGLKEGEVYVADGTEIYVADEKDYLIAENDAEIEIAEEGESSLYIEKEEAEELGLVFYPGTFTAPTAIIINGEGDEEMCVLDWSTGTLEFRGKMSSSARSFFKYFLKPYVDEYITEELGKKDEILILPHKKAIELRGRCPIGAYTYFFKDTPWPIAQIIAVNKFIEWLYFNDYKIMKNRR